ncbi:EAL domain-containing protein [Trichlorobacter lovleyi]|uniref:Diguanylate cyclase/phosphodiesterase with PAS/PAC sensor(S) n=1 Tax=Trichlorobacter lovleyi (strain ATCC BAA-1151 / DSM 17278 / SZ) TaxID=398767 RepID=B3EBJ5_TRIL1|nr:EAL domain-containing protein [Trichlorobacter lovleyi]ACD97034.1 diguanylate cyclase/phosphodiesterase with PAS/PAC sensor(s) [Trichlorobacter lovleyi SZ]
MEQASDCYTQIVEALPTPILLLRHNGVILHANAPAACLLETLEGIIPQPEITLAPHWIMEELECYHSQGLPSHQAEKSLISTTNSHSFVLISIKRLRPDNDNLLLVTINDLSKLHLVEDGLRQLVEGISEATGEKFFQFLALHLAKGLDADFAFIGEFADSERTIIQTVAVAADGAIHANFRFPLAETPCEQVLTNGLRIYPKAIPELFPLDHLALEMGVESYIGIPLVSSRRITLGPMAVFSRRPIRETHLAASMLQVFAVRAASELERRQAERVLKETEARLKTIVDSVHTGILVIDPENHRIVDVNELAASSLGRTREEMIGTSCHRFICPNEEGRCPITDLQQELDNEERDLIRADGSRLPVIKTVSRVVLDGREHLLESFVDISRRKQVENSLKESEERYRMLVENQADLVIKTDMTGNLLFVSPSFCKLFGQTEEKLLGKALLPVIMLPEQLATAAGMEQMICSDTSYYREYLSPTREGKRWIGWALRCIFNQSGQAEAIIGMGRDITDRKTAESTIEQLAYHDPVTGLPNRTLLHDRLQLAINRAERDSQGVAILFLDLDRFKAINDSLGHAMGDQLLRLVGNRLLDCVRSSDTVARLGGDEFVVLISALDNDHAVGSVVMKILEQLCEPYQIDDHEVYTSSSIGISLFPRDGRDAEELLKNADMAMYQAKEAGRNTCHFFSPELNMRATERLLLESTMRRALEREEFFLVYQPQMELRSGHIAGIEALLRWRHPDLGVVPPNNFIPIAEETGLIVPLGEWVLAEACRQAVRWQQEGQPPLRMAVNVSARQFRQRNLGLRIEKILMETGLDPALLELELTESAVMENPEEAILTLRQLKKMGITLSIDDFGTGYSSLSHLKHFPIDRLKIDRSFVKHVTRDHNDATIAEAIIALAHSMKLTVVAEGIEHSEQMEFMHQRHCDTMQGYYLSRPVTAEEFGTFLKRLGESDGKAHGLLGG